MVAILPNDLSPNLSDTPYISYPTLSLISRAHRSHPRPYRHRS
jgi:hypothetical protein